MKPQFDELSALMSFVPSAAQTSQPEQTYQTGLEKFDELFHQPLKPGHIIEWGLPFGHFGRNLPLMYLREHKPQALWINAHESFKVYPPSWSAFGVDLSKTYFIQHKNPLDLQSLYFEDSFRFLIIDSPKSFKPSEMAFLRQRAIENRQVMFWIYPFSLSCVRGNPFATVRINGQCVHPKNEFMVRLLKGGDPRPLFLDSREVFDDSPFGSQSFSAHAG